MSAHLLRRVALGVAIVLPSLGMASMTAVHQAGANLARGTVTFATGNPPYDSVVHFNFDGSTILADETQGWDNTSTTPPTSCPTSSNVGLAQGTLAATVSSARTYTNTDYYTVESATGSTPTACFVYPPGSITGTYGAYTTWGLDSLALSTPFTGPSYKTSFANPYVILTGYIGSNLVTGCNLFDVANSVSGGVATSAVTWDDAASHTPDTVDLDGSPTVIVPPLTPNGNVGVGNTSGILTCSATSTAFLTATVANNGVDYTELSNSGGLDAS